MKVTLIVIAALVLFSGLYVMGKYNTFQTLNVTVEESWANVETQYQRRFALVPGLVNATKGTLKQEQEVFGAIAEARTRYAGSPEGSAERTEATGQYESALGRLLLVMENYPELKSNETIQGLMDELAGTENRIATSITRYNGEVKTYNLYSRKFPTNMFANLFGIEDKEFFEAVETADVPVEVDLTLE